MPRHFYRVVQGIFLVCKFYVSRNVQILLHSAGVCDVGRSSLAYQQVIQKDVTGSVIPLEKQLRLAQHPAVKARRKLVGVGGRGLRKHPLFDWLYLRQKTLPGLLQVLVVLLPGFLVRTAQNKVIHLEQSVQPRRREEIHALLKQAIQEIVGLYYIVDHYLGEIFPPHFEGVVNLDERCPKLFKRLSNVLEVKKCHGLPL